HAPEQPLPPPDARVAACRPRSHGAVLARGAHPALAGSSTGRCERLGAAAIEIADTDDVHLLVQRELPDVLGSDPTRAGHADPHSKSLLETTEEDWDAIVDVNLRGVFLCCKRAVSQMLDQEPIGEVRGRLINISSQHGMVGPPGHVAYAASKGGVVNLTRQIAVDYGARGVLVNAVAPGKILTGSPEQQDPETLAYAQARTPFHRLGRPDDVAGAALF